MTRIAPIGTSRVFLPIRNLQKRGVARLIAARNYGYVHSSAEALQLARYMVGDIENIPPDLFPMVATLAPDAPRLAVRPARPDVYLVEISSRRALKHPSGWYLQANLMRERALDAETVSISNPEMKSHMTRIVELLGKDKVCFVTHINGEAADGGTITPRERLIASTTEIAGSLGVPVINPTELLADHEQRDLLSEDGSYLNYYNDDAVEVVGDFYLRKLQGFGWNRPLAA